ncbi:MAG: hypothetical protein QNJ42_21675 [Crocosphaera sp.]|nr:hypothetical protein [Crocosphaera sp.]
MDKAMIIRWPTKCDRSCSALMECNAPNLCPRLRLFSVRYAALTHPTVLMLVRSLIRLLLMNDGLNKLTTL